ncbi:hypothetical protein GPJ56_006268 [Histomonas meleagridis]|uniref:uncharacterized protein n=1 Tax=Histomonas meleagridis TaxID=135588 RepID=UPI0035595B8D|nr:hypothetical protein GPJ56_006268 [Histomonas meleagridis]KAH0796916.1 hypothetical protein GO595_010809 [Histomonas meleagridis]
MNEEEVIKIAEAGNGYVAIEKSSFVIRKLKRQDKIEEAINFLLKIANILVTKEQYTQSVTAVHRAVLLIDEKKDNSNIKATLYQYFEKITPDFSSPELYQLLEKFVELLPDKSKEILLKYVFVSETKENYNQAQIGYAKLILFHTTTEKELKKYIKELSNLLWIWILSITDKKQMIYNAQFIVCRCALAFLAQDGNGPKISEQFLTYSMENAPKHIPITTPLFVFTKHYIQAVLQNSPATATFLRSSYKKIIQLNKEISKWVSNAYAKHLAPEGTARGPNMQNLGALFQNILGSLNSSNFE